MDQQGQSSYPDSLTPREQEVLALLREGLTNPQIAERLGFTLDGAKYHVSEILGKLGVASRDEAARWEPSERPWWATGAAPMAWLWRRASVSWLGTGAAGILAVAILAGVGFLVWGLVRTNGEDALATLPTTLVLVRDNDLWLAPLDGSVPPRALTSGSFATQYAGYARGADGGVDLYYVEQLEEDDPTGSPVDAALYRIDWEGGEPEELLAFESRGISSYSSAASASLSPDGRYVLLTDVQGILLVDLDDDTTQRLLTRSPPCEGPVDCFSYGWPRWSPDGKLARIGKSFWEGGSDIVIDPFAEEIEEQDIPGGGGFTPHWSPDGERICVSELSYISGGAVLVHELATGETVDTTVNLELPRVTPIAGLKPADPDAPGGRIDSHSCIWSEQGDLTIAYMVPDDFWSSWIAILDSSFNVVQQSEPIRDMSNLVQWLPDGSGILINRWQPQEGRPLQPGIYYPDRGLIELSVQADAVLAVIP